MFSIPIAPENKYGPKAKQNLQFKESAFMKILKDETIETIEKCLQAHEASMDNEDIHYCISQPGDHDGMTPLMVAIQEDSVPKVQLVLSHNPNINVTNGDGATALMYAFAKNLPNCHQIVRVILDSLNDMLLDLDIVDTKGHTTLCFIGKFGNASLMDLLVEHIPAKLATANSADDEGKTPLYWACRHNCTVIVQKLILAGANPNLKPHNSDAAQGWMTPLMAAIHHYTPKSLETVNTLIQGQASLALPIQGAALLFTLLPMFKAITSVKFF
ncbi:Serine/threonine-protein phosphatase 6 regulatory ankyrin repeat subunit A [Entomophthora muscae]|uniref:Serine/threonine-protein phosphatase 6 regulatory ankyrin repeat subunit A n=1 Tax=Entomophthora muscae TaxID=34485 RepID=A0ACC2SQF1_9FUNG|nr:Serine/threonine-protein phosphatase 6 regulatory ankyrin repeat subunit A [Entomophthora muscae]